MIVLMNDIIFAANGVQEAFEEFVKYDVTRCGCCGVVSINAPTFNHFHVVLGYVFGIEDTNEFNRTKTKLFLEAVFLRNNPVCGAPLKAMVEEFIVNVVPVLTTKPPVIFRIHEHFTKFRDLVERCLVARDTARGIVRIVRFDSVI